MRQIDAGDHVGAVLGFGETGSGGVGGVIGQRIDSGALGVALGAPQGIGVNRNEQCGLALARQLHAVAQRETKTFSVHFAKTLVGELKNVARLHKHPLKSAGFKVLKAPDVPSVLIELGYVSNKEDLKQLTSGAWRSRTAHSVVQAVDTFFSTRLAGTPVRQR